MLDQQPNRRGEGRKDVVLVGLAICTVLTSATFSYILTRPEPPNAAPPTPQRAPDPRVTPKDDPTSPDKRINPDGSPGRPSRKKLA